MRKDYEDYEPKPKEKKVKDRDNSKNANNLKKVGFFILFLSFLSFFITIIVNVSVGDIGTFSILLPIIAVPLFICGAILIIIAFVKNSNINSLAKKIFNSTEDTAAVDDQKKSCPSCHTTNDKKAKYCNYCGTSLANNCSYCGNENDIDARFCTHCGRNIK